MTSNAWLDNTGLVTLPSGPRVRGRRQGDTAGASEPAFAGRVSPKRPPHTDG